MASAPPNRHQEADRLDSAPAVSVAAPRRRLLLGGFALAMASILFVGWRWLAPHFSASTTALAVQIIQVEKITRPAILRVEAELRGGAEAEVAARIAGRLTELRVKEGDTVGAGAHVATIHAGALAQRAADIEATLAGVRRQLRDKDSELANAAKLAEQYRELYQRQLIARRELEQVESAAQTARAHVDLLRAQLAQEEAMLQQTHKLQGLSRLVAPIGGVVALKEIQLGALVTESMAIMTIVRSDPLKVVAEVPGEHAKGVRPGMTMSVSALATPAAKRLGTIAKAELSGRNGQAVVRLEVTIANQDRAWQPGTAVVAELELGRLETRLMLPRSAVQSVNERHYVFKIENQRARRHEVVVAESGNDKVVIRSGVAEGDNVIAGPLNVLKDGALVRLSQAPARP